MRTHKEEMRIGPPHLGSEKGGAALQRSLTGLIGGGFSR